MNGDLSKGPVVKSMLLFAIPMILGDLLQQCYNIADTLIVGRCLGEKALAAVGSSFTLMTFITSIIDYSQIRINPLFKTAVAYGTAFNLP